MISDWYALALIPLGALLFRIRGGWLDLPSTTLGRAVWSVGMTIIPAAITWRLAVLAPALFLGCVLPWWKSIDMGRNEGTLLEDALWHTLRGFLWVLPAVVAGWWAIGAWSSLLLIPGGACAGLYELGWWTPSSVKDFTRGSEMGEVYFGASIGAALALAIILGV